MLDVAHKPPAGWQIAVKAVEDRMLALFLLILVAPVMVVIALVIKLDSKGPVLSRQQRYGFNNKAFSAFKFRTTYHDRSKESAPRARSDPCVTRVGGFLRQMNLDELPQLFNVLQGVMSLVGPRPHPSRHIRHPDRTGQR